MLLVQLLWRSIATSSSFTQSVMNELRIGDVVAVLIVNYRVAVRFSVEIFDNFVHFSAAVCFQCTLECRQSQSLCSSLSFS